MKQLLYRAALAFFLTVIIVSVSVMLRHSVFSSSVIGVDVELESPARQVISVVGSRYGSRRVLFDQRKAKTMDFPSGRYTQHADLRMPSIERLRISFPASEGETVLRRVTLSGRSVFDITDFSSADYSGFSSFDVYDDRVELSARKSSSITLSGFQLKPLYRVFGVELTWRNSILFCSGLFILMYIAVAFSGRLFRSRRKLQEKSES